MIFQTLDNKKECVGIYLNNDLIFDKIPDNLTKTWSYSAILKGRDIEYANIYSNGKSLEDSINDLELKQKWINISNKIKCHVQACIEAKINLSDSCFYNLVPEHVLKQYCEIKNIVTEHVFLEYQKPFEYNFFKRFQELLSDISLRELNIDLDELKNNINNQKNIDFYRKIVNYKPYINYNMFGTITGRLTCEKDSFPIQTFPKNYRYILKPKNDWFVSFDVNAAELRTSLALLGKDQYEEDLYEVLLEKIFNNELSRSECKQAVTAWLYNSANKVAKKYEDKLDDIFEKERLINTYWDGKNVYTPYNRIIESDRHNAISHLNQSTFIDLFHRNLLKVDDLLINKRSFISFLLHDEFVIDISDDEKSSIIDIINILQTTEYGKFLINVKVGKNFGNMKKINIKV